MKKVERPSEAFAIGALEALVKATGYPGVRPAMSSIGVDRTMLRELERKGLIKTVKMSIKGQYVLGYYTEAAQPVKFFEKIEKDRQEEELRKKAVQEAVENYKAIKEQEQSEAIKEDTAQA